MNLETQVKHYDKEYRNGNALITDEEFNKLERNLKAVHPDCDYFNKKLVLPSLPKDAICTFLKGLTIGTKVMLQPKYDGVAVAIEYKDGKINKAITRKGKDITDKMIRIQTVPLRVPYRMFSRSNKTIMVRGELYANNCPGNVSQRKAAGYLRSGSFNPHPNLKFCAFEILNSSLDQSDQCKYLSKLNFHTTRWTLTDIKHLREHRKNWINGKLWSNLPIDGLVVKINSREEQIAREKQYHLYPYSQMAIKY